MLAHRTSAFVVLAAVTFTCFVHLSPLLEPADQWALKMSLASRYAPNIISTFTQFGQMPVIGTFTGIIGIVVSVRRQNVWPCGVLVIAAICASATSHIVKDWLQHPRPDHAFAIAPYEYSSSFPSGHSLNAVVMCGVLALILERIWAYWAAAIFAVFMGISRIYLAHHWLSDVLGGWAIGIAYLVVFSIFISHFQNSQQLKATAENQPVDPQNI